jgi:hypothetical protein
MGRKYTGWDKDAAGKRAGTETFVKLTCQHFNNGVWNNGTWNVRPARGSGKPSVHGTGRAADLSWRANNGKGFGDYNTALQVVDFFVANAEILLIEEIHDYFLQPHGRGWRCDRAAWKVYDKPTIGTPGGDWWHVEIAPDHADDPAYYEQAFAKITGGKSAPAQPAPYKTAPADNGSLFKYPGADQKLGSKGPAVQLIQAVLKVTESGNFDAPTEAAVKAWQTKNGLKADGVVGPVSWKKLFG